MRVQRVFIRSGSRRRDGRWAWRYICENGHRHRSHDAAEHCERKTTQRL